LDDWRKNIIENIEIIKNKINVAYEQYEQEFNAIKENTLNNENEEEMSLKEVR
jgi:hypothetical protein